MSLLSKSEFQFLQGQKQVSKSYEYKLNSTLKKKLAILMEKELPLLSSLFPNLELTKFSKIVDTDKCQSNLTKNSKITIGYKPHIIKDKKLMATNGSKDRNKPLKAFSKSHNEQLYIKSRKKINNCNTWAGGLAWLRYRLDMAGVVGSNPTRPI